MKKLKKTGKSINKQQKQESELIPDIQVATSTNGKHVPEVIPSPEVKSKSLVVAKPVSPEGMLESVTKWVTNHSLVSPDEAKSLETTLSSQKSKFQVYLSVMAVQRVQRLQKLIAIANEVEEELFNEGRLAEAETFELINMLKVVTGEIEKALEFVQSVTKKEEVSPAELNILLADAKNLIINSSENATGNIAALPPAQRENVRKLLETFVAKVSKFATNGNEEHK